MLDEAQTRHARKVLRLQRGDAVELIDGRGGIARAVLEGFERGQASCRVEDMRRDPPPRPTLTVAAAMPKGSRADEMVNLLSQLGADRLIPLRTARSDVHPRPHKLEKFAKAAIEAVKQSRRTWAMRVDAEPRSLQWVLELSADVKLIATIGDFPLHDLPTRLRAAQSVLVLIGPVGDWTDEELDAARAAGYASWTLGPHVLRIEAAAAAATAIVRYLSA